MRQLKLLLTLLMFLSIINVKSQRLLDNFQRTVYTYIYKLDSGCAAEIYSGRVLLDSLKYYTHLTDSFKFDKSYDYEKLPAGHYLFLSGEGNNVKYEVYEKPVFRLHALGINRQIYVYAYNLAGEVIRDARLKLIKSGNIINFEDDCGCYPIPLDSKKYRNLPIDFLLLRGEDFTFGSYNYYSPVTPEKRHRRRAQRSAYNPDYGVKVLPGYLVLNQPKFKLLDSLKWKAFLLKPNGKPYNKTVKMTIRNDNSGRSLRQEMIKPTMRGAYHGEFLLADTLTLDNQYSLQLFNKKGRLLKSETFRVENYDLKKTFFDAVLNKNYFFAGEEIRFRVSAFDANNLPLADAKIKVIVTLAQVLDNFTDSLFVPFSWSEKYWEYLSLIDPGGNSEIIFPDSMLFNAKLQFNATISITTADGDSRSFNLPFTYDPELDRYLMIQEKDTIKAVFLHNSRVVKKQAMIMAYNNSRLYEKKVVLPYSFKVEDFPVFYQLQTDKIVVSTLYLDDNQSSTVGFEGYKTYDSIRISLTNPLGIKVHYKIYHGDKFIEGGSGDKFEFHKKMPSDLSVHVQYSFRWKGQEYVKEQSFHCLEKSLKVEISQPEVIYPGQKVPVSVHVTDFRNRNANRVNLTAYAVNAQLGDIKDPDIPYFGKVKSGMLIPFQVTDTKTNINNYKAVNAFYLKMRHFVESPYYKLEYNPSGLGEEYEDISSDKAEFSPYIAKGQENQAIYAVYADKKLVYVANTNLQNPYSFRFDPGTYNIELRTSQGMYKIKNVELIKGKKLFLCLRIDSISKNPRVSYVTLQTPYLKEEQDEMSKHLLYFTHRLNHNSSNYFLVQGNRIYSGTSYNHYTNFSDIGNYFVAGPFERGAVQLIFPGIDSLEFYFEPGSAYIFYDDSVSVKDIPEQYSKFPVNMAYIGSAPAMKLNDRPFPWPVVLEKPKPVVIVPPVKTKRTHPALHDYGTSWNEKPLSNFIFKNLSGKTIQKVWFFNRADDKNSRICFSPCLSIYNIKPGQYDIFLITDKDSVSFIKDYTVKADGTNYKFISAAEFNPYDSLQIANAEEKIVKLNRPLPRVFDNPPLLITDLKRTLKEGTKETRVTGYVMDENNNPIDMVTVFLENAGVFIEGAITNQMGYFELKAGDNNTGQLKIFFQGKYYNYYKLFLATGKTTEVMIHLPNNAGQPYAWLSGTDVNANYLNSSSNYSLVSGATTNALSNVSYESVEISATSGKFSGANFTRKLKSLNLKNPLAGEEASSAQDGVNSIEQKSRNKFTEFLDKIKGDTNANRIRSNFRDYAYFIPDLLTNKKGEAHFTVIFPDNQTLWKTIVPAMDYHKRSGLGLSEVKAFKPVNTTLALPRFMIVNDSVKVIGKIMNYTDIEFRLTSSFKIGNKTKHLVARNVKTFITDSLYLDFDSTGNYPVEYSFVTTENYLDGERRLLQVLINGTEIVKGYKFLAENDTSFIIETDPASIKTSLTYTNNQLDLILSQLEKLKNYTYGCNEQNASKIKALLTEKTIYKSLGREFTEDKLIVKLIHQLEQNQRKDGSWGWWNSGDQTEFWMTCYIIEALDMAVKSGFYTRAHIRGAEYLKGHMTGFTPTDKLFALELLSGFYNKYDYKSQVESFDGRNLSLQDHFRLIRLKQILGIPCSLDSMMAAKINGKPGVYWGEDVLNFKANIITTSALAYEVLKHDSLDHKDLLKGIRNYFLTHSEMARNTIEQAVMLQSIVRDIVAENAVNQEIFPELIINGMPYDVKSSPKKIILAAKKTTIQKKGAPLFFSVSDYCLEKNPRPVDSLFKINARMEQNSRSGLTFIKSIPITYIVEVEACRPLEYVMIEIPIPSSCIYSDKSAGRMPYEVQREYFNDKVVIFCRELPKGLHKMSVSLQPVFEGRSTVLPVKASLMYYPDHYGINSKKEVWVKD